MKTHSMPQARKGFTLVELMAVVAIIGTLAVVGVGSYNFIQGRAMEKRAETQMALFISGLERYKADFDTYPDKDEPIAEDFSPSRYPRKNEAAVRSDRSSSIVVAALGGGTDTNEIKVYVPDLADFENPQGWFVDSNREYVVDPWGNPWAYRPGTALLGQNPKASFDLWSAGPDGVDNTADDLTNF